MYKLDKIKKYIREQLSDFRYEHSLMVAEEAKNLAKHYGVDEEKAYVAGLIHDMAKDLSEEKNNEYRLKYNIDSSFDGKILHGEIGYYMAKEQGFDDEICNAVRYHTLGHVDMDIYSKIVLLADKYARNILNEAMLEEKRLAYTDLDAAIKFYLLSLKNKLGDKMHPWSMELLGELEK